MRNWTSSNSRSMSPCETAGFWTRTALKHYISRGGYFAFHKALTSMQPREMIGEIIDSGLRVCAWRSLEIEGKHSPALLRYYNLGRTSV